jgi:uncharacterized membrane protein
MSRSLWRRLAQRWSPSARGQNRSPWRRRLPLHFEQLEERILLSTLIVTNPADQAVTGELSLRQAVAAANADAAAGTSDTIVFEASLGSNTITLTQGVLELSGAGAGTITIDGSSPSTRITLSGSSANGLFQVDKGVQAVLANLNLEQGQASGNGGALANAGTLTVSDTFFSDNSAASGGAVENSGTLTVSNVTFAQNSATTAGGALDNTGTLTVLDATFSGNGAPAGGALSNEGSATLTSVTFSGNNANNTGGAIANGPATLTATDCSFENNSAYNGPGGAVANGSGTVTLNNATLTGNSASGSGGGIDNASGSLTVTAATLSGNSASKSGGGISSEGGTVTVTGSTLSGNTASQSGGGIENAAGTLTLTNATLSGNTASQSGGGIDNAGTLTLASSTISGNTGDSSAGGVNNNGGAWALQNTILVGNTTYGSNADFGGSITTDNGNNLLGAGVGGSAGDPKPGPGDVFNNNPQLAALGNYGGPTQTLALMPGSPAIGAGNAAAANLPGTDQRGQPRTVNDKLDIGAFQTQAPALVFSSLGQSTDAGQPTGTVTVALQDLDGNPAPVGTASYSLNGTTADASGSSNLTLVGGAGFAAGQTGQALSLSGTNQYAITPNLASLFPNNDASVTLSLSFNAAGPGVILDELGQPTPNNSGWHDSQIEILSDGTVKVRVWDLSAVTLGKVSFNAWHTVVLRYDAAAQKLDGFLDGVQATTPVTGGRQTPYGSGNGLYYAIGATDSTNLGSGASFKGLVQNFTVLNRALSNAEVQSLLGGGNFVTTVTLASSSSGGSFSNPDGQPITGGQVIVPPGASALTFAYTDTQPGTPTLTVSAPGFASATEQETILPAPVSATPSPDIVVGRTLSSYTTGGIQNNQETITYTVYNEQADPLTGVLLADTLQTGVTFATASQQPDQSGQSLAWSLGTIQGYDRASVTLTVNLATPTPLQLDAGAQAFATLDGGPVANATLAARLRPGSVDPNLLAAMPDANATDPFIQEEAAKLDYNPQNIFNFLHNDVGYNSYQGSLRGARGTLWSGAGNALDVASLGVALMRASGIPAQYVSGTLSQRQAQQLILSMFPANSQVVGSIPSGTQTADPANDSQLLTETESHFWFQFDAGSGLVNADPLMAGAQVGQTFTMATASFTEVPDNLRAKTEVSLKVETYSQAGAVFGVGGGISDAVVLDQTFNDVDLVGRTLTVGHVVTTTGVGALFTFTTNTYAPYLQIGDDAFPDPGQDQVIRGTDYQDVLSNFPLVSQVVTGVFLNVKLIGADGTVQPNQYTLADRVGIAARQNGASGLRAGANQPLFGPVDVTTFTVLPGLMNPHVLSTLSNEGDVLSAQAAAIAPGSAGDPAQEVTNDQATSLTRTALLEVNRALLAQYLATADAATGLYSRSMGAVAYYDSPRLTIVRAQGNVASDGTVTISFSIDLNKDTIRAVPGPGQNPAVRIAFNLVRGQLDTQIESNVLQQTQSLGNGTFQVAAFISAQSVMAKALAQGIPFVALGPGDTARLDAFSWSADAKALITQALAQGNFVLVPVQGVVVNGTARLAWYQIDPNTGSSIGVLDNGLHDGFISRTAALVVSTLIVWGQQFGMGLLAGGLFDAFFLTAKALIRAGFTKVAPKGLQGGISKALALADLIAIFKFGETKIEQFNARLPLFVAGFALAAGWGLQALVKDPPVPAALFQPVAPPAPVTNWAQDTLTLAASAVGGSATGTGSTTGLRVAGALTADWQQTTGSDVFPVQSLALGSATVRDAMGNTVGSGAVALTAANPVPATVSGAVAYTVKGDGSLSFYGTAPSDLGASGLWSDYAATLTGTLSLTLTTAGLMLNGVPLAAGTYTITGADATLTGSGPSTAPDFSTSASITATGAVVDVGPGGETLTVNNAALGAANGATLTGYAGSITVAAGGNDTVDVTLQGTTTNVLSVSATPSTFTTTQNTPVTFPVNVNTSLADTYTLTAQGPTGWTVTLDGKGNVTATPPAGLQGGTYPVRVIAQSTADPDLVAQTTVNVTITPTSPGITLAVNPDPIFTVPFQGAQVPTAFQAVIHNNGPTADTFGLTFANVPAGFTVLSSTASVTIPAGQTGVVGIYLQPTSSQLPAPGTPLAFAVTAASTSDPAVTQQQNVSLTMPQVDAVTLTDQPTAVSTTPGTPVSTTLTLTNAGNVAENVTLASTLPTGLTASPLNPVSLAIGQSTTETLTLTPDASTPLNSLLQATVTATFGPAAAPATQTLAVPVSVVAPGVTAIGDAAVAAEQIGNTNLAGRLDDLGAALTNLVQNPTSAAYKGQALANIDSILSQLSNDPFQSAFAPGLTSARSALAAASAAADVQAAVVQLGNALTTLATTLTDEAAHGFTLGLVSSYAQAQPNAAAVFTLDLKNTGTQATTYDLAVTGLPSNVTAAFSKAKVTLQPGQEIAGGSSAVTLSLTETGNTLFATGFTVTATAEGATEITNGTQGGLTLRDTFLQVSTVTTNPPFVAAGATGAAAQVDVTAKVQSTVNQPLADTVSFVVQDPTGKTIFTSTPVALPLTITSTLTTVDLGNFDTTGLAQGGYVILATVADPSGKPVPGSSGQGLLTVGLPVTASISTTPATVPTGTATVTTTVQVHGQVTFPAPLTVLGTVATQDDELSTVLYGNNLAYVVGANGITIVDISNPASPQVVKTFAQDVIVKGGYNIAQVVGHDLLVATNVTLNSSGFNFIVYDLTDPMNPALVSNTDIPYRFLTDMYVLGNVALFPIQEFDFYPGGDQYYIGQSGNILVVDISDLTKPKVLGEIFSSSDPNRNHPEGTAVIVNSEIAYGVSSTETGGDTTNGVGDVRLFDISNPAAPKLAGDLNIPDTETLTNIALGGNRALVVGSSGGLIQPFTSKVAGLTGNVTLTVLDISDPQNPKVLGNTLVTEATSNLDATAPSSRRDLVNLGNGLFALSNVLEGGKPAILLIDASDPNNIVVGALNTPALVNGLTVSASTLYAGDPTGLTTYQIGQLVSSPVTVSVQVPKDSTNLALQSKSFTKPPTQIISGTNADTYVWDRSLAYGNSDLSFAWQTQLSNLNPGDNPAVSLGTTVGFTEQGTPGTLALAGTSVTAVPIVTVSPATQTAAPGATATYDVRVTNPTGAQLTYGLYTQNLPFNWASSFDSTSVTLAAGASADVLLRLTSDPTSTAGSDSFTVTAYDEGGGGSQGTATGNLTLAGAPVLPADPDAHGVVLTLTPATASAGQGTAATYTVQVTNTGSTDDTFTLSDALPNGVTGTFSQNYLDVPPGASNFRDVTLTLTPQQGTAAGSDTFSVTATSESMGSVTGSTSGTLDVLGNGVSVSLSPGSGAPGTPFQLMVTNTGTVQDTFDLALGGPASMVSSLGSSKVALAPGASQTVPITTGAVNFADSGSLNLMGMATSEGNPAVQAEAMAALTIPNATGMTAKLNPATQDLAAPGATSFLLTVNNTGNLEDSYTATIASTTGPVTASLNGLDGTPTQTSPIFRLPGLSSGALQLNAALSGAGTGTVTIQVKSLSDPTIASTVVATVTAAGAVVTHPGTVQFIAPSYVVHESGGEAFITLTRAGGSDGAVSVVVSTANGTATAGADYEAVSQTVSWAAGDASPKTIVIPILDEHLISGQRIMNLTLSSPGGGATVGGPASAVLTILDDDPPVQLVKAGVQKFGRGHIPKLVLLTFNGPLDPTRANDRTRYKIYTNDKRHRQPIVVVKGASYDPANHTVTLRIGRVINRKTLGIVITNGLDDFLGQPSVSPPVPINLQRRG